MSLNTSSNDQDVKDLQDAISRRTGLKATVDFFMTNEFWKIYNVDLRNGSFASAAVLVPGLPSAIVESRVATMRFVAAHTSIPVPDIVDFNIDLETAPGAYIVIKKVPGKTVDDSTLEGMTFTEKGSLLAQVANWTVELLRHRFNAIGSLYQAPSGEFVAGTTIRTRFYTKGRVNLSLNRGPYSSTKDYLLACVQRELDALHLADTKQDSPKLPEFGLPGDTVKVANKWIAQLRSCHELDDGIFGELPFALDMCDLGAKDFVLSASGDKRIVLVTGWDRLITKPIWQCCRPPTWLVPPSKVDDKEMAELSRVHKEVMDVAQRQGVPNIHSVGPEAEIFASAADEGLEDAVYRFPVKPVSSMSPGPEIFRAVLLPLPDPESVADQVARLSLQTAQTAGNAGGGGTAPSTPRREVQSTPTATTGPYAIWIPSPERD